MKPHALARVGWPVIKRHLALFAAVLALSLSAVAAPRATTVILVRHAEKAAEPREDPPLDETGRARAAELARMLASTGITAIISTPYARTRQTATAVAERAGVEVTLVPVVMDPANPRAISKDYYAAMAKQIRAHEGGTVLVVGHSNTIPEIVNALGGKADPIDERTYDDLFVVTLVDGTAVATTRLKY